MDVKRSKARFWVLVVVLIVIVGVTGLLIKSQLPSHESPQRCDQPVVQGPDYTFKDGTSITQMAAASQCLLGTTFTTRILEEDETVRCTRHSKTESVKGSRTQAFYCTEGVTLTLPALQSGNELSITTVWTLFAVMAAKSRFSESDQAHCGGGYIARSQPGFAADMEELSEAWNFITLGWVMRGFDLRKQNKPISDCAVTGPTTTV